MGEWRWQGKRSVRDGVIYGAVLVSILVFALLLDWWKEHAAIGQTIVGVALVAFFASPYKFPEFRTWILKRAKSTGEKAVYKVGEPPREQVSRRMYNAVMARMGGRCENPDCKSKVTSTRLKYEKEVTRLYERYPYTDELQINIDRVSGYMSWERTNNNSTPKLNLINNLDIVEKRSYDRFTCEAKNEPLF